MWRALKIVLLIVLVLVTVGFTLANDQPVNIQYYFGDTSLPLAYLMICALVVGWALGLLSLVGYVFSLKHKTRQAQKALKLAEAEVQNLRKLPLKDVY